MSVDRSFARAVQSWLEDDLAAVPDPRPVYDRVFMQLPTTPQRRRWSVSIWRRGGSSTVHRAGAPASLNVRRDRTMFSAVRVGATVGVVLLSGGFLLANLSGNGGGDPGGGPFAAESPSPVASASPAPSIVPAGDLTVLATGTLGSRSGGGAGTDVVTPDSIAQARGWSMDRPIEMTDPRLTGTLSYVSNNGDSFDWPDRAGYHVGWGTWQLTAGDGTWDGDFTKVATSLDSYLETAWLVGSGSNEGLSAWLEVTNADSVRADGQGVDLPGRPTTRPLGPLVGRQVCYQTTRRSRAARAWARSRSSLDRNGTSRSRAVAYRKASAGSPGKAGGRQSCGRDRGSGRQLRDADALRLEEVLDPHRRVAVQLDPTLRGQQARSPSTRRD